MSVEAMKQALDAMEDVQEMMTTSQWFNDRVTALRQAIEQAEKQKPVAWSVLDKRTGRHWYTHESKYTAQYYANEYSHRESDNTPSMVVTPLYTAPPQREWVGLNPDTDFYDVPYWERQAMIRAEKILRSRNHVD